MAGTDLEIIRGLYDITNIQDRLRKYAQDKEYFRFWVLRQRYSISLLKIISEKFGTVPATMLGDWKFRYPEFRELPYSGFITSASGTTQVVTVNFPANFGGILRVSHRLELHGSYTKKTVATAADVAAAINVANGIIYPEICEIQAVNQNVDGSTWDVTLRRCYGVTELANITGFTAIATTQKFVVANIVNRANDKVGLPSQYNGGYLENVIQISRQPYGLGETMVAGGGIETFLQAGTDEFLSLAYIQAETWLMKAMERALILGKKREAVTNGNVQNETGGILEFIGSWNNYSNVSDFVIDLGGQVPTPQRMNGLIRYMQDTAGVSELWMFMGTEAAESLANSYENRTLFSLNGQLSLEYNVKVMTIDSVGVPMRVHCVTAPILNEVGFSNGALVLNLQEYNYDEKGKFGTFQIAHKEPFTEKPENLKSYGQDDGFQGILRELYGVWGLCRRMADTHFLITGFPTSNFGQPTHWDNL